MLLSSPHQNPLFHSRPGTKWPIIRSRSISTLSFSYLRLESPSCRRLPTSRQGNVHSRSLMCGFRTRIFGQFFSPQYLFIYFHNILQSNRSVQNKLRVYSMSTGLCRPPATNRCFGGPRYVRNGTKTGAEGRARQRQ